MSSLAECIKAKEHATNTSSKKPSYYNQMKSAFIKEMVDNEDESIRLAAASSPNCPATVLSGRLNIETETEVIKSLLMNPNLPQKAILKFTADTRAAQFDEDEDLIEYIDGLNIEA